MQTIFVFFFVILSSSSFSQDLSFLEPTFEDSQLELCKRKYNEGKKEGVLKQTPYEEDFKIDPEFTEQAWTWFYKESSKEMLFSGGLQFLAVFSTLAILYPIGKITGLRIRQEDIVKLLPINLSILTSLEMNPITTVYNSFHYLYSIAFHLGPTLLNKEERENIWVPMVEIRAKELEYESKKEHLPQDHKKRIEDIFENLKDRYQLSFELKKNEESKQSLYKDLETIDRILAIPQKTLSLDIDKERLERSLDFLEEEEKESLRKFVSSISYWSQDEQKSIERPFREAIYFRGAPGTGKKELAKELAKVFIPNQNSTSKETGLPIIFISANLASNAIEFLGTKSEDPADFKFDIHKEVYSLSEALTHLKKENQFKNALIVLDGIDDFLLNSDQNMKFFDEVFFDLEDPRIKLEDLRVDINTQDYNFILTGEVPLQQLSKNLNEKIEEISFPSISSERRMKIACKLFGKEASKYKKIRESDENLKNLIEGVQLDQKNNPGVNIFEKTIREFAPYLSNPYNTKSFNFSKKLDKNSLLYFSPYSRFQVTRELFEDSKNVHLPSLQKVIRNELDHFEKKRIFRQAQDPQNYSEREQFLRKINHLETMIHFPHKVTPFYEQEENLLNNVKSVLSLYPEKVRKSVLMQISNHITNSRFPSQSEDVSKIVLYFYGEPGTGKSYLVDELRKALNTEKIDLNIQSGKYSDFFGASHYDQFLLDFSSFSPFTKAMLRKGDKVPPKNSIVYIDEIDKVLNDMSASSEIKSSLNKLLDGDRKEFLTTDYEAPLDTSRYLFIFVGNNDIKKKDKHDANKKSIEDRLIKIKFEGFEYEAKQKIAKKYFLEKAQLHQIETHKEDLATIWKLVDYNSKVQEDKSLRDLNKAIDYFVTWLHKRDGDFPYIEVLKMIAANKDKKDSNNEFSKTRGSVKVQPLSDDQEEFRSEAWQRSIGSNFDDDSTFRPSGLGS